MSIFKEIGLAWQGEEYIVSHDKVMGLIEVIEDIITLEELTSNKGIKRATVSKAFAVALRYAGCKNVSQQEVYTSFFNPETAVEIQTIVTTLLTMMIPPEHLQEKNESPKKLPTTEQESDKDS